MQFRRNNLPSLTVKLNPTTPDLQDGPKSASPFKSARSERFYFKSSTTLLPNTKGSSRITLTKEDKSTAETSYSYLPKLTQYQTSRSARWDILGEDIKKPDLTEENHDRNPRIKELLKEFLKLKNQMAMMPEREKTEVIEHVFSIAELILTLYKVSVNTISVPQMDSIMELGPLKSKAELLRGFLVLIPEICRFPYSFYTKIDLICFSFGGSLNIIKRTDRPMLEKKLFNGVFPLGVLATDEQIVTHFYKTVAFHLRMTVPDFDTRMTIKTRPSKSISLLMNTLNFAPPYESPRKKNDMNSLEEYGKLLKKLILQPSAMIKLESETVYTRVRMLKGVLEEIDMDGINDNFWRSLDVYHKDYTNGGFLNKNKMPVRVL